MFSSRIACHRTQYLKLLLLHWRSRSTDSRLFDGVRAFEDIPEPNGWKLMHDLFTKTERFAKGYKLFERLFEELGPIYKESVLLSPKTTVHVIEPEDIEKVFRAEGKYPRRLQLDIWFEYRKRRNYFPGLILLDGEEWNRVRQKIAPKMMRPKIVKENIANFNAVSKDAVARLAKLYDASEQNDYMPDLEKEVNRWSLEASTIIMIIIIVVVIVINIVTVIAIIVIVVVVDGATTTTITSTIIIIIVIFISLGIGTVAFDSRFGLYEDTPPQEALDFTKAVNDFFELSQQLLYSILNRVALKYIDTPKYKKFSKNYDTILDIGQRFVEKKMMEVKQMTEKGIDLADAQVVPLLTYLLMKEDNTPEEVNALAIDVVFAGVDTTSSATLWWLYNLARFPEVQENLYQEIQSVLGKDDDVLPSHLAKLRYLKACLKESMRLNPTFPVMSRILEEDVVLSGYNVPANTLVVLEFYATTRSDKYFKDPLDFKPERWLRESKEVHPFSHLQFGFGPRMRVVSRVAELEMYVFVCKLLQRFRLAYHHEPLDLRHKLLTVPDQPVKIKFVDRL
ncbi:1,25-dihydroxyvitamin D(3) 24-hydroxylase, mitochondrial-like [Porites lutea]|uniref:1,25-dihydroxyvitamin D(3) 24-hydroxylase, mitochondrial-like n=1 Tax=Porites lutea TaxID=51062 RepID=UPI003CC6521E